MVRKNVFIIFGIFVFIILFGNCVFASLNVSLSNQGTDVTTKSTGELLGLGDLEITVWDSLTGGNLIYNETFVNSIVNGSWNVMMGENSSNPLSLDYGEVYYFDYRVEGDDMDFTNLTGHSVERQYFYSPLGEISSEDISENIYSYYYNKTSATYTANLSAGGYVGYKAGNYICDLEFSGTHLCYESEVVLTIDFSNISSMSQWSDTAWIISGGAKYSPASVPVNDCDGFTHGVAGSYLGSFWMFNQTDGGAGGVGHCANNLPLACCKKGGYS